MSLIGETKWSILQELERNPSHGYAIADAIGISQGGVYTHLQELEEEGVICIKESDGDRKVYELTDDGRQLVDALQDD